MRGFNAKMAKTRIALCIELFHNSRCQLFTDHMHFELRFMEQHNRDFHMPSLAAHPIDIDYLIRNRLI